MGPLCHETHSKPLVTNIILWLCCVCETVSQFSDGFVSWTLCRAISKYDLLFEFILNIQITTEHMIANCDGEQKVATPSSPPTWTQILLTTLTYTSLVSTLYMVTNPHMALCLYMMFGVIIWKQMYIRPPSLHCGTLTFYFLFLQREEACIKRYC